MENQVKKQQDQTETKEHLNSILNKSVEALKPDNLNIIELKRICQALDIEFSEKAARANVLSDVNEAVHKLMSSFGLTNEFVRQRLLQILTRWLNDIEVELLKPDPLQDGKSSDARQLMFYTIKTDTIPAIQGGTDIGSAETSMLKKEVTASRFLMMLALQMVHRALSMPLSELAYVFDLDNAKNEQSVELESLKQMYQFAFLQASIPAFFQLWEKKEEGTTTKIVAESVDDRDERKMVEDFSALKGTDPVLTVGVVFGGSLSEIVDNVAGVRCLLDHLQTTMPAFSAISQSNDLKTVRQTFNLFLYCLGSNDDEVYKLTDIDFFSMDVREFARWISNGHQEGKVDRTITFKDFLAELKEYDKVISLTPALDSFAQQNEMIKREIEELDGQFLGSSLSARLIAQNNYVCLTYLKNLGFKIPILYRMKKEQVSNLELCVEEFQRFCNYHQIDCEEQEFRVCTYASCERGRNAKVQGLKGIIDIVQHAFGEGLFEEALIEPAMAQDQYIDFSCVVLETRSGPIALVPTEYQYLAPEYVRSLSSGLRRHSPPRSTIDVIQAMRKTAVEVFTKLNLSGYGCISGRVVMDVASKNDQMNKELPRPRPIPVDRYTFDNEELPKEFLEHMENVLEEKDAEDEEMVKAYESSEYSADALEYLKALDRIDAENGIKANRYDELHKRINSVRLYLEEIENEVKEKEKLDTSQFPRIERLERELRPQDSDLENEAEAQIMEEYGKKEEEAHIDRVDFEVLVTDINVNPSLSANSIVFHQAAISGLSHSAVLRHLVEMTIPVPNKLKPKGPGSLGVHPLFPEQYTENNEHETDVIQEQQLSVWVLCGGSGTGHQASMSAGLNVVLKLNELPDTQAHLFVLDSGRRVAASSQVFRQLYQRRKGLLKAGVVEKCLPDECKEPYLKSPKAVHYELPWTPVWCLSYPHYMYATMDEAIEASERARMMETVALSARKEYMDTYRDIQYVSQKDLYKSGVSEVASIWGGNYEERGPPPRMMTLDIFASEAKQVGALVFLSVSDDMAQTGSLQGFLDSYNIRYTGSGVTTMRLCGSKEQTGTYLADSEETVTLPQQSFTKETLIECSKSMEYSKEVFAEITEQMGCEELCIKPINDDFGGGVAHLSSFQDLYTYGMALLKDWEVIDGAFFSSPHCSIPMCKPSADFYLVEKYLHSAEIVEQANGDLMLTDSSHPIEISVGLVGEFGHMQVLNPSIILTNLETTETLEQRYHQGLKTCVTPIPTTIASANVVQVAKQSIERIANSLGLRGIARVDAFMYVDSGKLTIIEVDVCPNLNEHSVIFQQGVLENPPLLPRDILQYIVDAACNAIPDTAEYEKTSLDEESSDEEDEVMNPWEDNTFWESEDADELSEGSESLSNLWSSSKDEEETSFPNPS